MAKKILLIDDSKTVILMEQMILARNGYEVITAVDGLSGVEKARAELPDLILLDVVMPRMDGFEACRSIKADARLNHIPVILVTTRGEPGHVEQGYAAGCNDYMTKPIDGVELLTKVRSCLGIGAST